MVEGGSDEEEGGKFFVLSVEKVEDGGSSFFRPRKIEEPPQIFEEFPFSKNSQPSRLLSDLRSILRGLRGRISKIENGRVLRASVSNIDSKIGFEDRRLKMGGFRSSVSKIEDGRFFEDGGSAKMGILRRREKYSKIEGDRPRV